MISLPRTFAEYLSVIEKHGDAIALYDYVQKTELSYLALVRSVKELASKLPIKEGQRVVLYDISQIDWVVLFFAIQLRGGIAVPIDERVSQQFFHSVVNSTNPFLIVSDNKDIKENMGFKVISFLELSKGQSSEFINVDHKASKPCEIIFTSGTWSDPKGVVLSQQNLLANVEQILSVYPFSKPAVMLGILPLSHAYQQTLGLLVPLTLGSKVVFLKVTNSLDLISAIKSQKVDLIPMIPRVFELLQSSILRKIRNVYLRKVFIILVNLSYYLPVAIRRCIFYFIHKQIGPSLRVLLSGGSPFDRNLDRFFQGLGYHVFVGYGLSECSPIVTAGFSSERKQGEVGKVLPGITIELNHLNEVIVQGENVFLGYWPHIENKISAFNTGDIGEITKLGTLVLKGRSKNLIIFDNGEKCFCEDLERIINSHDGIESSCVVERRVSGEVRAECLAVLSENKKIDTARIINYVNAKLPLGIKLSRIIFVQDTDFPRTHTLKPNRVKVLSLLDSN